MRAQGKGVGVGVRVRVRVHISAARVPRSDARLQHSCAFAAYDRDDC